MIITINNDWQFLSQSALDKSTISLPICLNLPNFKTSERDFVKWSDSSYCGSPLYETFCRLSRILNVLVRRNHGQASFQGIENLIFRIFIISISKIHGQFIFVRYKRRVYTVKFSSRRGSSRGGNNASVFEEI